MGAGMQRQIARLAAFAGNPEMRHAFARVLKILDLELAQFLAPSAKSSSVENLIPAPPPLEANDASL